MFFKCALYIRYHGARLTPVHLSLIHIWLKHHGLNMVSVNKRNLFSLLVNNKEKSNTLEKNGVYEIHCAECLSLIHI